MTHIFHFLQFLGRKFLSFEVVIFILYVYIYCIHIFLNFQNAKYEVILAQPLIFPSKYKERYDLPYFSFTYFFFYSTLNINLHTFRDIHQKIIILRIFFKNNFLSRTDPLGWNLKYFLYNIFSSVTLIHILFLYIVFLKIKKSKFRCSRVGWRW